MSDRAPREPVSLRRFLGESLIYGSVDVASKAVGFLLLPITTAYLTPGDYGVVSLFSTSAQVLILLGAMGLPTAYLREVTERAASGAKGRVFPTALLLILAGGMIAVLPLLLAPRWFNRLLFETPGVLLTVSLAGVVLATLFNTLAGCRLQAIGKPWTFLVVNLGAIVVSRSTTVALIVSGWGVWGWLVGEVLNEATVAVLMAWVVGWRIFGPIDRQAARAMIPYGATLVPVALSHWVMTGCDKYMLRMMADDPFEQIGYYSVGERVSSAIQLVNLAFLVGWRRFAFHNMHLHDGPERIARGVTLFFLAGGYATFGVSTLGDDLFHWLIPERYAAGSKVIPLLALGAFAWGLGEVMGVGLHKARRTIHLSWINLLAAGVNVALNFATIPRFGIQGAAASTLACQAVKLGCVAWLSQRTYRIPLERRRLAIAGGWFLAAALASRLVGTLGWTAATTGQILIATLLPTAFLIAGFLRPSERIVLGMLVEQVRSIFARRRRDAKMPSEELCPSEDAEA